MGPELGGSRAARSPPGSWQWADTEPKVADLGGHSFPRLPVSRRVCVVPSCWKLSSTVQTFYSSFTGTGQGPEEPTTANANVYLVPLILTIHLPFASGILEPPYQHFPMVVSASSKPRIL